MREHRWKDRQNEIIQSRSRPRAIEKRDIYEYIRGAQYLKLRDGSSLPQTIYPSIFHTMTLNNKRKDILVQSWLDRAFGNDEWRALYPACKLSILRLYIVSVANPN
ncbi:hypothetical protein YC2023_050369 [Brassica napus]